MHNEDTLCLGEATLFNGTWSPAHPGRVSHVSFQCGKLGRGWEGREEGGASCFQSAQPGS